VSGTSGAYVHLNGRCVAAADARVSVFDRGFVYGDGLFETMRAYHGVPFGLEEHLMRLRASAEFLGIPVPRRRWAHDVLTLLRRNRLTGADAWVRLTVTRGVAPYGLRPPARPRPTVLITCGRVDPGLAAAQRDGVSVILLPFARHGFLAEHKTLNYVPAIIGKTMAARRGAFEGLFVEPDGTVTEGTTSNVFVWRKRRLITPPVASLLPGLTRRLVLEAAVADGLRVEERRLTTRDVVAADEVLLTASVVEVVPVIAVDGRAVGDGRVGPRTARLQDLYRQVVAERLSRRPRVPRRAAAGQGRGSLLFEKPLW